MFGWGEGGGCDRQEGKEEEKTGSQTHTYAHPCKHTDTQHTHRHTDRETNIVVGMPKTGRDNYFNLLFYSFRAICYSAGICEH